MLGCFFRHLGEQLYFTSCRGETNCPKQTFCSETSKKTDTAGHMFKDQLSCPGTGHKLPGCSYTTSPLPICNPGPLLYKVLTLMHSGSRAMTIGLWMPQNLNTGPHSRYLVIVRSLYMCMLACMHTIDVLCRKRTACSPALSSMGNDLK